MATNTCHISNAVAPVRGKWRNLLRFCMLFGVWVDLAAYKECADSVREFFFCLKSISQLGNVYFGDNGLVWLFSRSNSLGISEPVLLFLKTIQKKSLYCKTRITQLIRKDQCMSALFFLKKSALKNGILSNALLNACKYGSLFRMPLKAFSLWKLPFWRKPKKREIQNLLLLFGFKLRKRWAASFFKKILPSSEGFNGAQKSFWRR